VSERRDRDRNTIILAIQALSDALYKNERMGEDDQMGERVLRSGAEAATYILAPSHPCIDTDLSAEEMAASNAEIESDLGNAPESQPVFADFGSTIAKDENREDA